MMYRAPWSNGLALSVACRTRQAVSISVVDDKSASVTLSIGKRELHEFGDSTRRHSTECPVVSKIFGGPDRTMTGIRLADRSGIVKSPSASVGRNDGRESLIHPYGF